MPNQQLSVKQLQLGNSIITAQSDGLYFNGALIGGTPLPSSTNAGSTSEVWFSSRVDGLPGNGTVLDPFDGSTTTKFDNKMQNLMAYTNLTIHLSPGTYITKGSVFWSCRPGWKIRGAGMDTTILQMQTTGTTGTQVAIISSAYNEPGGIEISDLTVDGNAQNITGIATVNGQRNFKIGGIFLYGSHNKISRVKVKNCYGSFANALESFDICIEAWYNSGTSQPQLGIDNIIENCFAESPRGNYHNAMSINQSGGIKTNPKNYGIIRDCTAIDYIPLNLSVTHSVIAFSANTLINNLARNCSVGLRWEPAENVLISGNQIYDCYIYGIAIDDAIGADNITIVNNIIEMRDDGPIQIYGIHIEDWNGAGTPGPGNATNVNCNNNTILAKLIGGGRGIANIQGLVISAQNLVTNFYGRGHSFINNKFTLGITSYVPTDSYIEGNRTTTGGYIPSLPDQDYVTKDVYIALRTDAKMGKGTQTDPFNGSLNQQIKVTGAGTTAINQIYTLVSSEPPQLSLSKWLSVDGKFVIAWSEPNGQWCIDNFYGNRDDTYYLGTSSNNPYDSVFEAVGSLGSGALPVLTVGLDVLMGTFSANTHIHFGVGTFFTNINHSWLPQNGWTISGSGMYLTTLQAIGSMAGIHYSIAVIQTAYNIPLKNVHIKDITVDGNWPILSNTADNGTTVRTFTTTSSTSNSPTVISTNAAFEPLDVGRVITGTGIPSNTYIGIYNTATSIGLSSAPTGNVPINVTVSNGTILTLTEKHCVISCIGIGGSNNTINSVRGIGAYGSSIHGGECFVMAIGSGPFEDGSNNHFKNCLVEQCYGNYANPYAMGGFRDSPSYPGIITNVINSSLKYSIAIGNQGVIGYPELGSQTPFISGGVNMADVKDIQIIGNTFIDCMGISYLDTGGYDNIEVSNNTCIRGFAGIQFVSGFASVSSKNVKILNNKINIQRRVTHGANYGIVISQNVCTNSIIDGNIITYDASGPGGDVFWSIGVGSMSGGIISNNICDTEYAEAGARGIVNGTPDSSIAIFNNKTFAGQSIPGLTTNALGLLNLGIGRILDINANINIIPINHNVNVESNETWKVFGDVTILTGGSITFSPNSSLTII